MNSIKSDLVKDQKIMEDLRYELNKRKEDYQKLLEENYNKVLLDKICNNQDELKYDKAKYRSIDEEWMN